MNAEQKSYAAQLASSECQAAHSDALKQVVSASCKVLCVHVFSHLALQVQEAQQKLQQQQHYQRIEYEYNQRQQSANEVSV